MSKVELFPTIDSNFNLEDAIRSLGFSINEKDGGWSMAYNVRYKPYGEIFIEFYQAFITHVQSDMKVYYYDNTTHQQVLYYGIAPTNQRDFNTLMQLLLPSQEFVQEIENNHFSNQQN